MLANIALLSKNKDPAAKKVKKYGIIGGALTGGGAFVYLVFPFLLTSILEWQMQLKKDENILTSVWQAVPIPLTTRLYFWNLENPEEFQNGAKPIMREMGPYSYSTYLFHEIESWGENEATVTYYMKLVWYFDEEKTVGSRNDKLTLMNPVAYGTGGFVRNVMEKIPLSFTFSPIVFGFLNVFLAAHGEGFIKETTVGALIEGEYMSLAGTAEFFIKPLKWLDLELLRPLIELFETRLANNKFGLLHAVNNTRIGPYTIWTGQTNPKMFDRFVKFHDQTKLTHWPDPKCNMMNGTQGLTWGTYINSKQKLYVFFGELGRPLYLNYKGMSFEQGPAYRFRIKEFFASPNKNPDNKCFCSTPKDMDLCDGMYDIGPPYFGAPASVSLPHFLYASNKISSTVDGMSPDPDKHEAYFDVPPAIGSPIGGRVRIQANLLVKPVPLMVGMGDLPNAVYPFIWLELAVAVDGILGILLQVGMYLFVVIELAPLVALFSGLGMLGIAGRLAFRKRNVLFKPREQQIPIEPNYAIDRQTETKTRQLYPNLFSVSNGQPTGADPPPPIYDGSQQRQVRRERPETVHRQITPLNANDIEQGQQRIRSPPGAVE